MLRCIGAFAIIVKPFLRMYARGAQQSGGPALPVFSDRSLLRACVLSLRVRFIEFDLLRPCDAMAVVRNVGRAFARGCDAHSSHVSLLKRSSLRLQSHRGTQPCSSFQTKTQILQYTRTPSRGREPCEHVSQHLKLQAASFVSSLRIGQLA